MSRPRYLSAAVLGVAVLGGPARAEATPRDTAPSRHPKAAHRPSPGKQAAKTPLLEKRAPTPPPTTKAPARAPARAPVPARAPARAPEKRALAPALAKSAVATAKTPPPKSHENAFLEVPDRAFAESTLAFRYANLSDEAALDELTRRHIAWIPATPPMPGVHSPIRLSAPLHGVRIHSTLPPAERAESPFEILDARLALALDDFCALLARHDVVELVHYTMYRPPGEVPTDWQRQIRHPAGLAIDVGALRKRDGSWLAVGPHWPSNIGAKTCGEGALEHTAREARELASIVCEAKDERIFHFALTPDFNADHADHIHFEIKPATRWFIVN